MPIDYKGAARRHFDDAKLLEGAAREPNAGQLFGFCAECGLKALLVAHGLPIEADGNIRRKPDTGFREHMPTLGQRVSGLSVFHDGRQASSYMAMIPSIGAFADWLVDHRYFDRAGLPLASIPVWATAASEVVAMIDKAVVDGVM